MRNMAVTFPLHAAGCRMAPMIGRCAQNTEPDDPLCPPLPLAGEHRPPLAAVLRKNAEAELRLWRSQERGGWGKSLLGLWQRLCGGAPTPALPASGRGSAAAHVAATAASAPRG